MTRYLTREQVLHLHAREIERLGGSYGVRAPEAIGSALELMQATFGGEELYPTLAEKAAYLEKYKAQMADLAKAFDELKAAIEKGDADASKAIFEKLSDSKEKGHKDFGADCE